MCFTETENDGFVEIAHDERLREEKRRRVTKYI